MILDYPDLRMYVDRYLQDQITAQEITSRCCKSVNAKATFAKLIQVINNRPDCNHDFFLKLRQEINTCIHVDISYLVTCVDRYVQDQIEVKDIIERCRNTLDSIDTFTKLIRVIDGRADCNHELLQRLRQEVYACIEGSWSVSSIARDVLSKRSISPIPLPKSPDLPEY